MHKTENFFGQKPDWGDIGIRVHSLVGQVLTKNQPKPLAAIYLNPRPLSSLVMVLRCGSSVQGGLFMAIQNGGEKGNRKEEGMVRMW